MKTTRILLALAFASTLAACGGGAQVRPAPAPAPAPQACNAANAQFAIGQAPTASVIEEARRRSGAQMARVLRPGQVVTLEFNGSRLNLDVDASDRVVRVRCG
jgi:hypothetical protein